MTAASPLNFVSATADPPDPGAGRVRLYAKNGLFYYYTGGGAPKPLGLIQPPAFAFASNPGLVVTSVVPGHVVDTRAVVAGAIVADQIVEATIRAFVAGVNNTKSILFGADADLTGALTLTLLAAQVGIVTFTAQFLAAHAGNNHTLTSRADLQSTFALGLNRGAVTGLNLATTPFNFVTQAWVANAADSITIDSISLRLIGGGL